MSLLKRFFLFLGFIITLIICGLNLQARCLHHRHEHTDRVIVRCRYTQKDLRNALQKTPERYKNMGCIKHCFYCGCPIKEHKPTFDAKKVPLD